MDLSELRLLALAFWLVVSAVALAGLVGVTWLSDWRARRRADRAIETPRPTRDARRPASASPVPEQKKAA